MFDMTGINGEVDFRFFAMSRMLLSVGLPFVFIPIMTASFAEIPHNKTDMASALINMARNTGGSIGISLANNILAHREQFHQSRLIELVNTSTTQYAVSGRTEACDGLFRGAGQRADAGSAAGFHLDSPTGADADGVSRLHRRILGADADFRRRDSPGSEPYAR
jgi:hypothetical protein